MIETIARCDLCKTTTAAMPPQNDTNSHGVVLREVLPEGWLRVGFNFGNGVKFSGVVDPQCARELRKRIAERPGYSHQRSPTSYSWPEFGEDPEVAKPASLSEPVDVVGDTTAASKVEL